MLCSSVRLGDGMPMRADHAAIVLPMEMPSTSDSMLPNAADAMALSANVTPSDMSIWSPKMSMPLLSTNPNPMNGMPDSSSSLYF